TDLWSYTDATQSSARTGMSSKSARSEQTKQLDEGDGGSSEPSDDRNGLNEPISLNRYNAPLHALLERRGARQSAADRGIAQKRGDDLEKPTICRLIRKDKVIARFQRHELRTGNAGGNQLTLAERHAHHRLCQGQSGQNQHGVGRQRHAATRRR